MSDNPNPASKTDAGRSQPPVTHEDVRAIADAAAAEAVAAHMASPAASPEAASDVSQHMITTNRRLEMIEGAIGLGNAAASIAGEFNPVIGSVAARLPAIEAMVFTIMDQLRTAFPKLDLPDLTGNTTG